jgi:hypothetical protein
MALVVGLGVISVQVPTFPVFAPFVAKDDLKILPSEKFPMDAYRSPFEASSRSQPLPLTKPASGAPNTCVHGYSSVC